MTERDARLTVIAVVWAIWAVGAEVISIRAHVPENHLLDLAVGAAYLVVGLIAMRRRPGNRIGPLMLAVAFLWFIGNYSNARVPLAVSLGAFANLSLPFVVWLFFAYPTGRLQTTAERVYISAFVAWEVVLGIVVALTLDPRAICAGCVHGALALFPSVTTVARMRDIDDWLSVVLPVVGSVLLVLKHRRASSVERRALVPIWIGGACLITAFLIDAFVTGDPTQGGAAYTLFQLEDLARMAVPLCFLWGLLRSNLDRGRVGDLIERLSGTIPTGGLRDAMADVLHDPASAARVPARGVAGSTRPGPRSRLRSGPRLRARRASSSMADARRDRARPRDRRALDRRGRSGDGHGARECPAPRRGARAVGGGACLTRPHRRLGRCRAPSHRA